MPSSRPGSRAATHMPQVRGQRGKTMSANPIDHADAFDTYLPIDIDDAELERILEKAELPALLAALAKRSEEHTSELQSLMRISYAVFCLNNKKNKYHQHNPNH